VLREEVDGEEEVEGEEVDIDISSPGRREWEGELLLGPTRVSS
jgi:hypothetical protein